MHICVLCCSLASPELLRHSSGPRYLRMALEERVRGRGEQLLVELYTHVVNYEKWLATAGVEAYNAFVPRHNSKVEVPHSFSFKLRQDLTGEELHLLERASWAARNPRVPQNPHDVFVLVKTFMSDLALQQAPELFLPVARAARVQGVPNRCLDKVLPTEDKVDMWLRLAQELEKPSYDLQRAVAFLRRLARPPADPVSMTDMTWLGALATPLQVLPGGQNPLYQHLPELPWQLRVRYKRI